MLAKYYRFRVLNSTDQTITYNSDGRIELAWIPWKYTSGAVAIAAEVTQSIIIADGSLAAAAEAEGAVVDNSSNLYVGLKGTFRVIADVTSTDGTMYLYMEESTDNTIWPSDQADFAIANDLIFVCSLAMSTDATDEGRAKNFSL